MKYTPGASARTSFAPGMRSDTLRPVASSSTTSGTIPSVLPYLCTTNLRVAAKPSASNRTR